MNPTAVGAIAVLIWGASLPIARIIESQIGIYTWIGISFLGSGTLALIKLKSFRTFDSAVFKQPALYGRWIFFVAHEAMIMTAVGIVSARHMPFVILLNYLWPTAIILCSIAIARVRVTRLWAFVIGTLVVLMSLSLEIMGSERLNLSLFDLPSDRLAYLLAFCGAISWGLYCAITRRAGDRSGGGSVVPLFQLTLGLALPISFLPALRAPWQVTAGIAVLAACSCFAQFVAYLSWDYGMRKGNIVALSLFADFIPWMSLVATALIVKVELGVPTILSALTLVAGAMITRYGTR